jgi:Tripartite tricarboxylate transporter TctB family
VSGARAPQDIAAGALFAAIGGSALAVSWTWRTGTLAEMGSGFVPQLVAGLLLLVGLGVFVRGLLTTGEPIQIGSLRPLLVVTLGVLLFAGTLERFGIVAAVVLVVALSAFVPNRPRLIVVAALAIGLSAACVGLFVRGLGLPVRVWPF